MLLTPSPVGRSPAELVTKDPSVRGVGETTVDRYNAGYTLTTGTCSTPQVVRAATAAVRPMAVRFRPPQTENKDQKKLRGDGWNRVQAHGFEP